MDQQQQQGGQAHQPPKYDIQNGGHYDLYSGPWSNINQGLTGPSRDILATYWQQTINHLETETHDFKMHQLPLARIKKVMKADPEVKMISAEAPILFAKGCDIFITELTMRAWIHAEDNKRRTLQRSDIAAALGKSDMFDFLIDIVPREESTAHGGAKRPTTSGGQAAFQPPAAQSTQPQAPTQQQAMGPPDYGQMHHAIPQDSQYRQPGMAYSGHIGGEGQQDPTQPYGQQMFSGQDMYNPYATSQNFGGQMYAGMGNRPQSQGYAAGGEAAGDGEIEAKAAIEPDGQHPRLAEETPDTPTAVMDPQLLISSPSQQEEAEGLDATRQYNGRWVPTSHLLRRDTSFVGASLEFALGNVSSAYLQLRNDNRQQKQKQKQTWLPTDAEEESTRRLAILPGGDDTPPSAPVSLRVEFKDRALHFDGNAYGIIALIDININQQPLDTAVRVLLAAAPPATTLELEGLWLNHGAHLKSSPPRHYDPASSRRRALIEAVTSSSLASSALLDGHVSLLASSFNISHHNYLQLPYCLTATACPPGQPTIRSLYFRSGLPFTSHFPLPYHFPHPPPSIIILDLGLQDYSHFLSASIAPPSAHSITQFNQRFIQAYAALIKSIRAYRYPHPSSSAVDMPLHLVQRVRHDHGDTSTFWLDTTGWVHSHDFRRHNDHDRDNSEQQEFKQIAVLTAQAHVKIAGLLGAELCAYLNQAAVEGEACPFRKAGVAVSAPYMGNVVVPDVSDMGVLLEERKWNHMHFAPSTKLNEEKEM
ncbi:hypothetical protein DV737_g205, partial [Chaetothyriales sp. CBS 132003]